MSGGQSRLLTPGPVADMSPSASLRCSIAWPQLALALDWIVADASSALCAPALPSFSPSALQDGTTSTRTFTHVPSSIEAEEAEEIGVEHLLRDIALPLSSSGSLSSRVASQLSALKGLHARLVDIRTYLSKVVAGELPVNHQILYNLQDVFNLLPGGLTGSASATGIEARVEHDVMGRSFRGATNDQMLVVYLSSLIRSVIALHNLCVLRPRLLASFLNPSFD